MERPTEAGGGSFLRSPAWLTLGFPLLVLLLLIAVEAGGWNARLFYIFNGLSRATGPGLWMHLTVLGDGLVCATLLLPWIRRHPERVWGGLLGAVVMVVILRSFKAFWSLPRPLGVLPEETVLVLGPGHRRSAFPSGHAATFFLLVGVWALSTRVRLLSVLLILAGSLVGISRIVVGVHWPSDVLAGAILGWATAWLGLRWAGRMPWGLKGIGQRILGILLFISALVLLFIDHTGYPGVLLFQRALATVCLAAGAVGLSRIFRSRQEGGFSSRD